MTRERQTNDAAEISRRQGRYDHREREMTEVLDPQMEAMMEAAKPKHEHEWLQQFVGDWEYETIANCPGSPPETSRGKQSYRALGDLWLVGDGEGEMPPAGCGSMRITLGYDPQKGKFVGTWVGSVMPMQWVYEGSLDAAERVLTLESDGPSFTKPGEMGKYRDIITVVSDDHHTLTGTYLDDDSNWQEMMTTHYRRKK
jgi:hypothetical protein